MVIDLLDPVVRGVGLGGPSGFLSDDGLLVGPYSVPVVVAARGAGDFKASGRRTAPALSRCC